MIYFFGSFFIGLLILVLLLYYAYRSDLKKVLAEEKINEEFLRTEFQKPLSRVAIKTSEGYKYTVAFEPQVKQWIEWSRYTSAQVAADSIYDSYKRGYFITENRRTIPVCNVIEAYIEEMPK